MVRERAGARCVLALCTSAIVLLLVLPFAPPVLAATPSAQQIDDYLKRVEAERGLDAAVLVVFDGKVLVRSGYGTANDATAMPFTAQTVVGIASLSKQFTAAAIMRLVDDGRLTVDARLGDLLPGVPADKAGITVHQLLTHTAGLQSDYMKSDLEPLTKHDALRRIFAAPLVAPPGTEFNYANSGYTLLAAIVEQVSGSGYYEFLRREFFDPFKMNNTGDWADPRFAPLPVSAGYMNGNSCGPVDKLPGPYWTVAGNGDILSTVDDMYRWYQRLHGGKVLSPASTRAMFTSYTTTGGTDIEYGYGWEVSRRAGLGRLITHNGAGITGNSILSDYLDQRLIIIILGNRVTYRTLWGVPLQFGLPADETTAALAQAVATGDYGAMPSTTWSIWPWLAAAGAVLAALVAAIVWGVKRRRRRRRRGLA